MATEWNGEGIPPVGTECEAKWHVGSGKWFKVVLLPDGLLACLDNGKWDIRFQDCEFRPLQSEEQKQVAEIAQIIRETIDEGSETSAQTLYNAGFRKVSP